ncbi:hypothetical protein ACFE04_012584 [Oxalis oulophora]
MFKSAKWRWTDKPNIQTFKLNFHATQVGELNVDALMIFVVPAGTEKESATLEMTNVITGTCHWKTPIYETVKFLKDPKTGKIKDKLYHFVVSTGVTKSCVLGAASIDFAEYLNSNKASTVSLPIKYSKSEALLHVSNVVSISFMKPSLAVTVQRQQRNANLSDVDESEDKKPEKRNGSLKSHFSNGDSDMEGNIIRNSIQIDGDVKKTTQNAEINFNNGGSRLSCRTIINSDSSSGLDTPRELGTRSPNLHSEIINNPMPNRPAANGSNEIDEEYRRSRWDSSEGSDLGIGTDDSTNSSQETIPRERSSDDEIDKLKAEVVSISRKADLSELELQTLKKQIVKESRRGHDLTKEVAFLKHERDALLAECQKHRGSNSSRTDGGDPRTHLEETKEELTYQKELNSNLRLQLQRTQDSNAELLLAIQDMDEMLKEKDKEISNLLEKKLGPFDQPETIIYDLPRSGPDDDGEDEEQKALEEIMKDHRDAKQTYVLEQHIMDLETENEIYQRDKEELEMQIEQLALDYEILKQENHDMSYKLEQSQIQEQLKMQYECSVNVNELATQIENLENELEKQSKDFSDSLSTIKDLETRIETLEDELGKQAVGFEADLESVMHDKVKQEQRAIKAEQDLRVTKQKNFRTAEKLQEELHRLSQQMGSTFEANEQLAFQAFSEASDLRLQNGHLQEMLKKINEDLQSIKNDYAMKHHELEQQKRHGEEMRVAHAQETLKLKAEIERFRIETNLSVKQAEKIENLECEVEQMKKSKEVTELLLQIKSTERNSLVTAIALLNKDSNNIVDELNRVKCIKDENERSTSFLQSELATLQIESKDLKQSLFQNTLEKEKLRKEVFQLKDVLDKEVANYKEKLKLLEGQIKSKEAALDTSTNAFLVKEKELKNKIEELESTLGELSHQSKETGGPVENGGNLDELLNEVAELKERNKEIENELNEMQEKYSEISLKFAEVENERQQLVMTVRSLKNNAKNKKT